ncbi:MAG: ParB/RepB/Spo0J family partition protein [Lachnospiraceae bacterium]|jgi:ParB family chromosome partitioning protein|nr:ParB/RepB/Spo0J family partition protein [Lachnospiraceae bacterium]
MAHKGLGRGLDGLIKAPTQKTTTSSNKETKKNSASGEKVSAPKKTSKPKTTEKSVEKQDKVSKTGTKEIKKEDVVKKNDAISFDEKDLIQEVSINSVEPNTEQPRHNFDIDALTELSESISKFGIITPLLVVKKEGYYEIVAGERRWRAAKMAGLKKVPVIVKEYSEKEISEISLIENLQRENLNPIEEALAYKKLIEDFNLKQDELAERVSKSRATITNAMRLLRLPEEVRQMIVDEIITTGHGRALLGIMDQEMQVEVANRIVDENLSVREVEKIIKSLKNPKKKKAKPDLKELEAIYKDIANKIEFKMGTKVKITPKDVSKGKIEIDYYSTDELDKICDLLISVKE